VVRFRLCNQSRTNPGAYSQALGAPGRNFLILLRLLPVIFAAGLLGAHFWRMGIAGGLVAAACAPAILLIRRRWAARVVQTLLVGSAVYWLFSLARLAALRQEMGMGWGRLAVILVGVALATAAAALSLESRALRARYRRTDGSATASLIAFWLTAALLTFVQLKVERPMILAERFWAGGGWPTLLGLSVYAAWITELLLDPARQPKIRSRMWLAFSAFFFAQLLLGLAGIEQMLMSGELHLPVPALIVGGPLYRGSGFFMPVLFGVTVLLMGPAWCSYFCYIGAWDNQLSRAHRPTNTSGPWHRRLRWITLAGVVVVALVLRMVGAPTWLAVGLGGGFGVVGVVLMILWSRRTGTMAHCTWYCPIGLVATGLGKLSPHRIHLNDNCTACGLCSRACRYDALSPEDIARHRPGASCTLCGDCVGQCKHDALGYRFASLSPATSRAVFFVLVASFHAVCLAVARM
jgi:ferredoxin